MGRLKKIQYGDKELLPPISDVVFKALFVDDANKDLLAGFLSGILGLDIPDGSCIEVLNSEQVKKHADDKKSFLDLRVRVRSGENIDVEIQVEGMGNMIPRSTYYTAKMFAGQAVEGEQYIELNKAIGLVVMNFSLLSNEEEWYNKFNIRNAESGELLTDLIELNFIELPKLMKKLGPISDLNAREKWAAFLGAEDFETLKALADRDELIGKAVQKLVYVSEDERTRCAYEMEEKARMYYLDDMHYSKQEGKAEGIRQKALDAAQKLKEAGVDAKTIADCVGLPLEEIQKL